MIIELDIYDGFILHNRFSANYFTDPSLTGNIIAFRAPMKVEAESMIDAEDVENNDFIYSDDAINFLWEIPLLASSDFGAVAYQRLLNTEIANILSGILQKSVIMNGDDIMVIDKSFGIGKGKCSVSITHCKEGAALGHTGINIRAGERAPSHAYSTNLSDNNATIFMDKVIARFYTLNESILSATQKIISH
jgi:hypothetical protein